MKWDELLGLVLEDSKEVNYDDIQANFDFHDFKYAALGDVKLSYDAVSDQFDAEVKLFGIHVLNDDGSFGGEVDRPMPEMIRDAQYALQDEANEIAAEKGDFEGVRSSRHPAFGSPDEPRD